MDIIKNESCPMCLKKSLTLIEDETEIPYFGKVFIFSMQCEACGYKQSDLEPENQKDPSIFEFETQNKKDLDTRVVRSSQGTIKIPTLRMSLEPFGAADGFVSNIESVLLKFKKIIEGQRDSADEPATRKKAKNLLKKLWKIECGEEPVKIVIEDPTGNSAIIHERAIIKPLKVKKKK
jgi:zinc finger protein